MKDIIPEYNNNGKNFYRRAFWTAIGVITILISLVYTQLVAAIAQNKSDIIAQQNQINNTASVLNEINFRLCNLEGAAHIQKKSCE